MKSRSTRVDLLTVALRSPFLHLSHAFIAVWLPLLLLAGNGTAAETTRISRSDGSVVIEWSGTGGLAQLQSRRDLEISDWPGIGDVACFLRPNSGT